MLYSSLEQREMPMNTTVIGRKNEKLLLDQVYKSDMAELIAIYGRRRIGKTFLVRNTFSQKPCIYFQVTGIQAAPRSDQLKKFIESLSECFYENLPLQTPSDWLDAFKQLNDAINRQAKNKKIVIFIDELPWLAGQRSGALEAIEYYWNQYWSHDKRIKLIVCGSSASWIIKKIIKNKGGLHNRVTQRIHLQPFNLHDTKLYLNRGNKKYDDQKILKLYMVFGGVPFYLQQVKPNRSIDQNINDLIFTPDGSLFNEFDEVFSSLFTHSDQYIELIDLISGHKNGIERKKIEELNKKTGKGGQLTKRLEDLEAAGFIVSRLPFNQTRGYIFAICDEFTYFYHTWVKRQKSKLKQQAGNDYWHNMTNTPAYNSWQGYAFEKVCYKHLKQLKAHLRIQTAAFATPWRLQAKPNTANNGAEIDLLFDRQDNAITICEVKYSSKPYLINKSYAKNLLNKKQVFISATKTKKEVFMAMITNSGLVDNLYADDIIDVSADINALFDD